jgi:hypothetical protein
VIARPFVPNRPARLQEIDIRHEVTRLMRRRLPDAMQVTIGIWRAIIVDDDVDPFNINPTAKDISGYQNSFLKCLESSVSIDSNSKIVHQFVRCSHTEILTVLPAVNLSEC